MTKEAMKLALNALNLPRPSDSYPPLWRTYENTINTAIKALEEALKQEQDEPDYKALWLKMCICYDELEKGKLLGYEDFKNWMVKEMPQMTIIGNPEWWAMRIYDKFIYTKPQLKQEQGELVAGYYFPLTNEIMRGSIEALIAHAKRARWTDAIVRKDGVETKYEADWIKKLVPYTTPQQRKPLTFEQVEDCFGDGVIAEENGILISAQWLHDFARAIESAHGIKE